MTAGTIATTAGPVSLDALGVTLMHEHIFINLLKEYRADGLLNDVPLAVDEVRRFKDAGGSTIVDMTNRGLGQHPLALRRVAEASGVRIVLASGFYRHQYFDADWIDRTSTNDVARLLIRDLTEGIGGTDIRAGIIGEIACDEWITGGEERIFRAAARAHRETGAPISTHAARWPVGAAQLDLLAEEGVDPRSVIVGHSDFVASVEWSTVQDVMDYHLSLAERGAFVQFDTIQAGAEHDIQRRISYVLNMAHHGYLDRLLLSHDVCTTSNLHVNGGGGYAFILEHFVPRLREQGMSEREVTTILVDNPRRALTWR